MDYFYRLITYLIPAPLKLLLHLILLSVIGFKVLGVNSFLSL